MSAAALISVEEYLVTSFSPDCDYVDGQLIYRAEPDEQVFTQPPSFCIEVLSPEDTFARLQSKFDDFLNMAMPNIWVLDPASRRAWTVTREGLVQALDGILRTTDGRVVLPIADLFQPGEI